MNYANVVKPCLWSLFFIDNAKVRTFYCVRKQFLRKCIGIWGFVDLNQALCAQTAHIS